METDLIFFSIGAVSGIVAGLDMLIKYRQPQGWLAVAMAACWLYTIYARIAYAVTDFGAAFAAVALGVMYFSWLFRLKFGGKNHNSPY